MTSGQALLPAGVRMASLLSGVPVEEVEDWLGPLPGAPLALGPTAAPAWAGERRGVGAWGWGTGLALEAARREAAAAGGAGPRGPLMASMWLRPTPAPTCPDPPRRTFTGGGLGSLSAAVLVDGVRALHAKLRSCCVDLMGIGLPAAPRDDTVAEDVAAVGGAAEATKSDAGDVK